jgi:DUF1680 family protein
MSWKPGKGITRRELLQTAGNMAVLSVVATPIGKAFALTAHAEPVNAAAGVDRVVMRNGKTYLNGWVGYGDPPRPPARGARGNDVPPPPRPTGPPTTTLWSKKSGPGNVTFADSRSSVTTATFSAPGEYVLEVIGDNGETKAASSLTVKVELPPPAAQLMPVVTKRHTITSPLWAVRTKALIVNWIPHVIEMCERIPGPNERSDGGIDNFIEAGKALRGEPYAPHKGYVFSNAWVHQTVESMSLALMVDPLGDPEVIAAQEHFRATLEKWIPIILSAQHPDGYLQTAFTLRNAPNSNDNRPGGARVAWTDRWQATARANHEGYVSGYFLESAINHYVMTDHKDARLYNAAKKLADCWADHIGPSPKQEWFDGHQEMEQALVRFGRFVNQLEGGGKGDRYIALAKFLLDCRKGGTEYDQSHLPVIQQYEAVGHAVRAVYTYSGMADVAVETHDVDYQSAVKSIWDNVVHRKYYLTGGIGSGESSEGFGPNYSLRNNSYCEACSSCGETFFQWKLHLAYHDAKYADLYEQTLYNALLGALELDGKRFYYVNDLATSRSRAPWNSVACCTGNIPRTLLMLPTWTYSRGTDGIYVNLFVGGKVVVEDVVGTDVEMVQTTNYPWEGKVSITVNPKVSKTFTLRLRVPNRDVSALYTARPEVNGSRSITVNGQPVRPSTVSGYVEIKRTWKAGDTVELELPLHVQRVYASEKVAADKGRVALRYGPLVYNIEQVDQNIEGILDPQSSLTTEWRGDLLGGVTVIHGRFADGSPLLAIPNFARFNRQPPGTNPAPPPAVSPPLSIVWIRET